MFWLFDKDYTKINFSQIFHNYRKFKDSGANSINFLYDFNSESELSNEEINKYNLKTMEPTIVAYNIKVKDSFIQYYNDTTCITFHTQNDFVKENDEKNVFGLPCLKWKYVKTENCKLPNISLRNYDFYYQDVKFVIYKINQDKLFIIEIKKDSTKKYILEKDIL
jgi:hypothetical protein